MYLNFAAGLNIPFTLVLFSPPDLIYQVFGVGVIRNLWIFIVLISLLESILLTLNLKFGANTTSSKSLKLLFLSPFIIAIVIGLVVGL